MWYQFSQKQSFIVIAALHSYAGYLQKQLDVELSRGGALADFFRRELEEVHWMCVHLYDDGFVFREGV